MKGENDFSSKAASNNATANTAGADRATPDNVFHPAFLDALERELDSPGSTLEAELRGPWRVAPIAPRPAGHPEASPERWALVRTWEDPEKETPYGTFEERERALLYAAALGAGSQHPRLEIGQERDDRGLLITEHLPGSGLVPVGHVAIYDEDAVDAVRLLDSLVTHPIALAQVLEAAGPTVWRLVGRYLAEALRGQLER